MLPGQLSIVRQTNPELSDVNRTGLLFFKKKRRRQHGQVRRYNHMQNCRDGVVSRVFQMVQRR